MCVPYLVRVDLVQRQVPVEHVRGTRGAERTVAQRPAARWSAIIIKYAYTTGTSIE